MTDTEPTDDTTTETTETTMTDEPDTDDSSPTTSRVRTFLNYAILAGLVLLALIAVLQFYLSASQAIRIWVTPEYRPLFNALFNLVVLLVAGIGILRQLGRLEFGSGSKEVGGAESDDA